MIFRRLALLALLAPLALPAAAHAQHVVTDAEAGKLTLEALTATPPRPRPVIYRHVASVATRHGHHVAAYHGARHAEAGARVRTISTHHIVGARRSRAKHRG